MNAKPWLKTVGLSAVMVAALLATPHEGTRYVAYRDSIGVGHPWSICNGHTEGVKPGDTATPEQCQQYLKEDMQVADDIVGRCLEPVLNVNQNAAFDDAVFNIGPRVVCGSTLQRLANAGDVAGACRQLSRWVYAGNVKYQGLIGRRADEVELCLSEPIE